MNKVRELYSAADIRLLERKKLIWSAAAAIIGAGTLIACALFAAFAGTLNAEEMELRAILTSAAGGCAVIFILINPVAELRHELGHARMLCSGQRERVSGEIALGGRVKIPGSIEIRRVTLGGRRLSVIAGKAAALPEGEVTLYAVNNYIAAWEEADA